MFLKTSLNKGGDIMKALNFEATLTDTEKRVSNIIAVDVKVSNIVIHFIDEVILPPNLNI